MPPQLGSAAPVPGAWLSLANQPSQTFLFPSVSISVHKDKAVPSRVDKSVPIACLELAPVGDPRDKDIGVRGGPGGFCPQLLQFGQSRGDVPRWCQWDLTE